jgi:hypothetical protein
VPDFSKPMEFGSLIIAERFNSSYLPTKPKIVINGPVLCVCGIKVGTIRSTGGTGDMQLAEHFLRHLSALPPAYAFATQQCSLEALWRTIIWDCDDKFSSADRSWGKEFKEWLESQIVLKYLFPGYRTRLDSEDSAGES